AFEAAADVPPNLAGLHILAADWPMSAPTIAQAIARMPEAAKRDRVEWHAGMPLEMAWDYVLKRRIEAREVLPQNPRLGITDDRPFNEYFWLRRTFGTGRSLEDVLPVR
ncbi:MAG TPA: hypothetical protein VFT55_04875, partial [Planctomycetota bacterium]|nr:hypothetical protein [Planctomycetota bacterium]